MGPLEITFLVIGIVAGVILLVYLALVIMDLVFFFSFNQYWKKHKKGLEVVLNMKQENLLRVFDIFKTNKIAYSAELKEKLESIDSKLFEQLETKESKQARDDLSIIRDELFYIASQNPHILTNEEYLLAKENVLEQDVLFRKYVAMYNADVLGFNYWSQKFMPTRYIFKIFKVTEKEII